jgi:hypothetical protein
MDGQKFDKLTRAFAAGTDRRTLLKIFGGASVAAVAGAKIAAPTGVFAQGTVPPGGTCTEDSDCLVGFCSDENVCYCEDPDRPVIGCPCTTGTQDPCYGTSEVCCANEVAAGAGADGTCVSNMVGCEPVVDDTCISGTLDACTAYNEAYGVDYICCNWGGKPGSAGKCVAESSCVEKPPVVGSGVTAEANSWIAPAAAVGAAAAVLAYRTRDNKSENEA